MKKIMLIVAAITVSLFIINKKGIAKTNAEYKSIVTDQDDSAKNAKKAKHKGKKEKPETSDQNDKPANGEGIHVTIDLGNNETETKGKTAKNTKPEKTT